MQISKFHKILRYIRRPLCFVVVLSVVAVYLMTSVAYADGVVSTGDFVTRFQLNSSDTYPRALERDTMKAYYQQDGHDPANITYNMQYFGIGTYDPFNINTLVQNNLITVNSYDTNNIVYDLSNCHVLMGGVNNTTSIMCYYFYGNGNFAVVNNVVVSDEPFTYFGFYINNYNTFDSLVRIDVGTQAQNGLYEYPFYTWYSLNCNFTDLDVYFPSSDSGSGFTSYSSSSTDFDFSDVGSYYNFNYLKTKDYIVSPADPVPEEEPAILGEHYNYAYVDGYIRPKSETDIAVNLSFSFNDYMRLHPNEYEIRFQWYATLTGNNLPSAYGSNYFEHINTLPLSSVTGFNGWNQGGDNSRFQYTVTVNGLKNSNNKSLQDAFEEIYILGGGDSRTYNSYSIIEFLTEYYTGYSNETVGKWAVRGNFTNILTKITLGCKINIVWVGGEPEQSSGKLWITYDTDSGSQIVANDIGVNYNPPSEPNPNYPAEIKDSNGNIIVNSGGSNIAVNPTTYANFNAIVEYLFNLDASDLNNIAGNTHNAIQTVITSMSDTSSNGFLGVLEETYNYIPDPVWNWVKTAVAIICGGAVIGWVYRVGRVKNGG